MARTSRTIRPANAPVNPLKIRSPQGFEDVMERRGAEGLGPAAETRRAPPPEAPSAAGASCEAGALSGMDAAVTGRMSTSLLATRVFGFMAI
jgi:hypothetical protein